MAHSVTTAGIADAKRFEYWRESLCDTFIHLDFMPTSDRPFYGELVTSRLKEITFTHVRSGEYKVVRTPQQIRRSREAAVFINFQLSGNLLVSQDGRELKLEPGDLTCCDSTRPYSTVLAGDFEEIVVHVPRDLWIRNMGPTENLTARAVRGTTQVGTLAGNFLRQVSAVIDSADPITAHRLSEVSLALIATAFGEMVSRQETCQSSGRIALLYRAKMLIEENLHDSDLNPEKIARALKISERYLQRLFQEENSTVCNWVWERRLEKCRRELSDRLLAGKNVSQIAFDCGFSNFSHFSRRFKRAYGISASDFRREQRLEKLQ